MHKNLFIFIFLFLVFISYNYTSAAGPIHSILNNNELNKVPSNSKDTECDFDILILFEDTTNTNSFGQLTSTNYSPLINKPIYPISKNESHALYNIILRGIMDKVLVIDSVIKRDSISDYSFSFQVSCKDINFQLLNFENLLQFKTLDLNYYQSLWNISGIEYPTLDIISYTEDDVNYFPAFKKVINEIYSLSIPPTLYDGTQWVVNLYFYNSSNGNNKFKLTFPNSFKNFNDDFITSFNYYPNYSPITNIGFYSTPIYSFKYTKPSLELLPFFLFKDNKVSIDIYEPAIPVSGKVGEVNYLGTTFQGYLNSVTADFQFKVYSNNSLKLINQTLITYQPTKFQKSIQNSVVSGCIMKDECFLIANIQNISKTPMTHFQVIFEDTTFSIYNRAVLDFPFGYQKGTSNNFTYSYSFSRNPSTFISFYRYFENSYKGIQTKAQSIIKSDISSPSLNSISFNLINDRTFLIELNITETLPGDTGLDAIYFGQFKEVIDFKIIRNESLVNNGLYQFIYDFMETNLNSYQLILIDTYDNKLIVKNEKVFGLNNYLNIKENYLSDLNINNLIQTIKIKFLINNLNTTNLMYNNEIYLEMIGTNNNQDNNIPIIFEFSKSRNKKDIYYLKFDQSINKWKSKFRVPANLMEGSVNFKIYPSWVNFIEIPNSALSYDCQLNVTSNYFDYLGPLITNIEKIPVSSYVDPEVKFGWYITISDEFNGFKDGYIIVRGDIDNSIYNFTLNSSNNLLDSFYVSKYQLLISIPNRCKTMNYSITEIYLEDTQGQITTFGNYNPSNNNKYPQQNSLLNYMDRPNDLLYSISCIPSQLLDESSFPQIISWKPNVNSIDSTNDNKLSVDFEVYDLNGLKMDQLPVLYVIGYGLQIIQTKCNYYDSTDTNFKYRCEIIIPFHFGYLSDNQTLSLLIYGLISNNGNFNGYSTSDLNNLNLISNINITLSDYKNKQVKLISSYYDGSSQLMLYGHNLNNIVKIFISDDLEVKNKLYLLSVNSLNNSESYLAYQNLNLAEGEFYVQVLNQFGELSNAILLKSTLLSPTGPISIQEDSSSNNSTTCDNLECGQPNRGYCKLNIGCVCFSPYVGKDCSSQIISIPQPDIDKEKPETTIQLPEIKSIISLVSIREIDFITFEPVFNYTFDKWTFKEISETKYQYFADVVASNGIDVLTTVNVTLEWFKVQTNLTFANQQLIMNPSTMKYTIQLSKYSFKNNLNSLQIILKSQIESSKSNNQCSSKEFGDSFESNYLKLQIENKSFYGRYIKRAIIDDILGIEINNELLDSNFSSQVDRSNFVQSFVGITIPHFNNYTIIDPDFSILIDSNSASSSSNNSICSKNKSLTSSQLAGIIIGSVAFFFVILLLFIKIIYSSPRFLNVKIFFYRLFKKLKFK